MKNPVVYYAVIALGIIVLAVGIFFLSGGHHPVRAYGGLGAGIVLIIAGIVGMFVLKPKASAQQAK
jgi:uncharacterized membrane protein